MMGYIYGGKYFTGQPPEGLLSKGLQSTYRSHEHDRQRKDFSRELIQPYMADGSPNPNFVQAFPEESREYGFLPKDEELHNGQN